MQNQKVNNKMPGIFGSSPLEKKVVAYMNDRYLNLGPRHGSDDPKERDIAENYVLDFLLDGKYIETETGKVENANFRADERILRVIEAYCDYPDRGLCFLHDDATENQKKIGRKITNLVEHNNFTTTENAEKIFMVLHPKYSNYWKSIFGMPVVKTYSLTGVKGKQKILTLKRANGKVKQRVLKHAKEEYADSNDRIAELVKKVKSDCVGVYVQPNRLSETHDKELKPFGLNIMESSVLWKANKPSLSEHDFTYESGLFFGKSEKQIPETIKMFAKRSLQHSKCLYILNYKPKKRAVLNKIKKEYASHEKFDFPDGAIDKEQILTVLDQIKNPSCIYSKFTGIGKRVDQELPMLVGPQKTLDEVMKFLKAQPDQVLNFYSKVVDDNDWVIKFIQDNLEKTIICDAENKPEQIEIENNN